MKLNLMQQSIKLSNQKIPRSSSKHQTQEIDLTSKAFFIGRQLMESKFAFSKKALSAYLQGKPVVLQQKDNEQPPSGIKGYMYLQQVQLIEEMIEVMLGLSILVEERITIKKKSTKRLVSTIKYDWNLFPKVIVQMRKRKSVQHSQIKNKEGNLSKQKEKSRMSIFLKQKTVLPINEEKRQQQMRMKTQKQRQLQQLKLFQQEEEIRLTKQKQVRQIQLKKKQEEEMIKKQQQRQLYESQMNSFWMKQRQKIVGFVCPKTEISVLESPDVRKSNKQKQQANNDFSTVDTAGHVLQMQMKELMEKENQKKNPIKPIVSWSFMKNTLGIDSSQSQNEKKKMKKERQKEFLEESKSYQESVKEKQLDQNLSIIEETNSQKRLQQEKKFSFITHKKDKQKDRFNKNPLSQKQTPFLKQRSYPKIQIQQDKMSLSLSDETDATRANHKIKSKRNKQKVEEQVENKCEQEHDKVFAQNPQESMFASCYYSSGRRSTQSVRDRNQQFYEKEDPKMKQMSTKFENNKMTNLFSFKRTSIVSNKLEQTITVAKKPSSRTSSFQELSQVLQKCKNYPCTVETNYKSRLVGQSSFKKLDQQIQQMMETRTMALPKKMTERRSIHDIKKNGTNRISFCEVIPKIEVQMFSHTMTTPEPIKKSIKTSTKDLKVYANTQIDTQIKRDSFVEELIADYFKRK